MSNKQKDSGKRKVRNNGMPSRSENSMNGRRSLDVAMESNGIDVCGLGYVDSGLDTQTGLSIDAEPKEMDPATCLQIEQLHAENEVLMTALHATQERLEQVITSNELVLTRYDALEKALSRLRDRYPGDWDVESIELIDISTEPSQPNIEIRLKNLYDDQNHISEIHVHIEPNETLPILSILRTKTSWLKWFKDNPAEQKLLISLNQGAPNNYQSSAASELGPTDWDSVQRFVRSLDAYIASDANKISKTTRHYSELSKTLTVLNLALTNWPMVPRYDDVKLIDTYAHENYKSLHIELTNISLGQLHLRKVEYRLSSSDSSLEQFGTHPRLEFPSSMDGVVEGWFKESDDGQGPRLELRFSMPNAMDLKVWRALSDNDKILIAGIIASLPTQLSAIARTNMTVRSDWQEWAKVGLAMKQIISAKILSDLSKI